MTETGPRLVASRCLSCRSLSFPYRLSCTRCSAEAVAQELLADTGTLWTWTVQTFRPKPPYPQHGEFTPFGVGYVELDGQIRVETRLTESDPSRLHIGMPVQLRLVTVPAAEGDSVMFAFGPTA